MVDYTNVSETHGHTNTKTVRLYHLSSYKLTRVFHLNFQNLTLSIRYTCMNNISKSQPNVGLSKVWFILMASSRNAFESISLFSVAIFSRLMQSLLQILHLLMFVILLDCKNCRPYSTQKHLPDIAALSSATLTYLLDGAESFLSS